MWPLSSRWPRPASMVSVRCSLPISSPILQLRTASLQLRTGLCRCARGLRSRSGWPTSPRSGRRHKARGDVPIYRDEPRDHHAKKSREPAERPIAGEISNAIINPLSAASRTRGIFTAGSWGYAALHPKLYAIARSAGLVCRESVKSPVQRRLRSPMFSAAGALRSSTMQQCAIPDT